jgi:hypothetical protein
MVSKPGWKNSRVPASVVALALAALGMLGAGLPAAVASPVTPRHAVASPVTPRHAVRPAMAARARTARSTGAAGSLGSSARRKPAGDPCAPARALPRRRGSRRALTIAGPSRPYTTEPATYCGTLTLPGKARLQPVAVEINGKIVATAQVGVDRSWHASISVTGTPILHIRAVWKPGAAGQLISRPLTIHPTSARDVRPTSLTLIAKALAAHRISRQTALVDKVFALLAPSKLPKSLVGAKPFTQLDDGGVLAAVADGWHTLSARQRATLLPYLGPYRLPKGAGGPHAAGAGAPNAQATAAAGSGAPRLQCNRPAQGYGGVPGTVVIPPFNSTVPPGWAFIGTTHFKIWYVTKDIPFTTAAQSLATARYLAAEAEKVWNAETSLFGRTPPSDASQPCNGGDGRIDIYAIREFLNTGGLTTGFDAASCQRQASFMYIAPDYANSPSLAQYVLAHDFFHTLQVGSYSLAGPCQMYDWLGEATATWAVDFVYPSNNLEQPNAETYFKGDFRYSLDTGGAFFSHSPYEDYIFLFFLARQFDPTVIRDIWDNAEHADPRHAIDAAVPGGLAAHWHEFALDNWNRAPLDSYTTWDNIPYQLSNQPDVQVNLGGQHSKDFPLRAAGSAATFISSLSSDYLYVTVTDQNVSHLTFTHYGYSKSPPDGMRIDALIELGDGTFLQQDWTSGADHSFCREQPSQDVVAVLLMASNGTLTQGGNFLQPEAKVQASDACVPTGYQGTVTNNLSIDNAAQNTLQVAKSTVSLAFDAADSNPALGTFIYNSTGGTVQLSINGTGAGGCTITGSGSFAIAAWQPPNLSGPGAQIQAQDGIGAGSTYVGNGVFTGSTPITETIACPGGSGTGNYFGAGQWWQTDPNGMATAKIKKGQVLSGTLTTTGPDGVTETWTWNLQPVFGP